MTANEAAGGIWGRWARFIRLGTAIILLGALVYVCAALEKTGQKDFGQPVESWATVRASRALREATLERRKLMAEEARRCRGPTKGEIAPRLMSLRQWHSCKPRQRESITLVTQLSLERLGMLESQCSIWADPIAAVVYVPTVRGHALTQRSSFINSPVDDVISKMGSFHERVQREGLCILDLELATQGFDEQKGETASSAWIYPVNSARNRALMLAKTEALLLLDSDFMPSALPEYKTIEGYSQLMRVLNRPGALVLPAFETTTGGEVGKELALGTVQRGKAYAVRHYQSGRLQDFNAKHFPAGHGPTNFSRWITEDLEAPYRIKYREDFEPYVLVSRRLVPWYDERFRGYGRNKIQFIRHLAGLNVTFSVHPTAFVVHMPHGKSSTKKISKSSGVWDQMYEIYEEVEARIRNHTFVPVVSFPELCAW